MIGQDTVGQVARASKVPRRVSNRTPDRLRATRRYLAGHLFVGAALGITTLIVTTIGDGRLLTDVLSWTLVALSGWCLLSWSRVGGGTFNLYGLFLWSMLAFHVGQCFLLVIGQLPTLFAGLLPTAVVNPTLLIIAWNIFALQLGALGAYALKSAGDDTRRPSVPARSVRRMGVAMVVVGLPASVILFVGRAHVVAVSGYGGLYTDTQYGGPLSIYQNLAGLFVPGCLFILAGSAGRWRSIVLSIAGILVAGISSLALGYRAVALIPLLAMLWALDAGHRRIPRSVLLLGVLTALFVVIPAVQLTRDLGAGVGARQGYLSIFSAKNDLLTSALSEMGSSAATVGYTYELVPQHREYDLGLSYVSSLAIIPPDVTTLQRDALKQANYDNWLIAIVDPFAASVGGSIGFSVVAEGYANFGWGGTAIMLALGFAIACLHTRNEVYSPLRVAGVATVMTVLLFLPRGEALFTSRPLFLYVVVPCGIVLFFHRVQRGRGAIITLS